MWNDNQTSIDSISTVASLRIGVSGQVTAGLIIAKQDARMLVGKNGEERGTLSFTIRDNTGIVNVTCWGTGSFTTQLSQMFYINSVVKLTNCNVQEKADTDQEKMYSPTTDLPFKISIDQKMGKVEPLAYGGEEFQGLQHSPVSKEGDFVPIDQIINLQSSYVDQFVNCLAVIKTAPNKRTISTKAGRTVTFCEFELVDNSNKFIGLVMWLESLAELTNSLIPKQTILFLTNVKVKRNSYCETVGLEATTKTIVTVNPDVKSAHVLYAFAQKLPDTILQPSIQRRSSSKSSSTVAVSDIKREVTVEEIELEAPENGILNAVLTYFECTDLKRSVSQRCTGCHKKVPGLCAKPECFGKDIVPFYDFTVAFTDHTGTTEKVKLVGECAEKLIGVPVSIFENWDIEAKRACTDRLLLERYKVYFSAFSTDAGVWVQCIQVDSWFPDCNSHLGA